MRNAKAGQTALRDAWNDGVGVDPRPPSTDLRIEVTHLESMDAEIAERNVAWRLLNAFANDDVYALVFWTLAFAVYSGCCMDEKLMSQYQYLNNQLRWEA
jgi:hypothetical protein